METKRDGPPALWGFRTEVNEPPRFLLFAVSEEEAIRSGGVLVVDLECFPVRYLDLSEWGMSSSFGSPYLQEQVTNVLILKCQDRIVRLLA